MIFKESETLELKKSTSELKEAVISIAAILNKHGKGEAYFGIRNDGVIVGQDIGEKTIREVSKAISENIEPKIYPKVEAVELEGESCMRISFHGNEAPYFAYGRAYMRVGDEDRQLSAKELESLFVRKNRAVFSWDDKICGNAKISDVSEEKVKSFVEKAGLKFDSKENALEKLGLFKDGQLLNAAIMFFAEKPQTFFPNAKMRGAVFLKGGTIVDMKDYEGDLLYLIDEAQKYVLRNTRTGERIEGLVRIDIPEINADALREAVVNAFCHRDYNQHGSVDIAVYPDQVEIRSPGKLYGGLTIKKITTQHVSERRNELIADLFHRIHLIEKWGRGIEKILLLQPKTAFKEVGRQFFTIFPRENFSRVTSPKQGETTQKLHRNFIEDAQKLVIASGHANNLTYSTSKVLACILEDRHATTAKIAKELKISTRAVAGQIAKLRKNNLIKRVGPDKGGHWEVLG